LHVLKEARTSNRLRTLVIPLPDSNGVDKNAGNFIFLFRRNVVLKYCLYYFMIE